MLLCPLLLLFFVHLCQGIFLVRPLTNTLWDLLITDENLRRYEDPFGHPDYPGPPRLLTVTPPPSAPPPPATQTVNLPDDVIAALADRLQTKYLLMQSVQSNLQKKKDSALRKLRKDLEAREKRRERKEAYEAMRDAEEQERQLQAQIKNAERTTTEDSNFAKNMESIMSAMMTNNVPLIKNPVDEPMMRSTDLKQVDKPVMRSDSLKRVDKPLMRSGDLKNKTALRSQPSGAKIEAEDDDDTSLTFDLDGSPLRLMF